MECDPGDESTALADVLDSTLHMASAMMGEAEFDSSALKSEELAYLAMAGGGFGWLADEPELYRDDDLQERFPRTAVPRPGLFNEVKYDGCADCGV